LRHRIPTRARILDAAFANDPALIILVGGSGAGKSVAAMQIASSFAGHPGNAALWVRLHADDAGIEQFWQRIMQSVAQTHLAEGGSMLSQLARGGVSAAP